MSMSIMFSLIFYMAFCGYVLLGMYILYLHPRNLLNRVFFAATLSLGVWAFCFAIANSAPDYVTSLFWRRVASLGWGSAYSVLLHFVLVLTERNKLLQRKWLYAVLYVPVLLNLYVFGFGPMAADQFDLVFRAGGWINVPLHTFWDQYFNVYYMGFSLFGLILIGQWGIVSRERDKKKQSLLLIFAFAIAVLLGTLTDVIVNSFMELNLPQMAPVAALIPIAAIFYSIRRYGLMGRPVQSQMAEPGKILSERNLTRFYQIMSLLFMTGGMFSFAVLYFLYHIPIVDVLLFSASLFIIGVVLQMIQQLSVNRDIKDTVLVILVSASVPFITLNFIQYANVTIWTAPIIFVVLSVIFNKRKMIYWLGASALLTQICAWLLMPSMYLHVDGIHYGIRILVLSVIVTLALYVNRIYIRRLEENDAQISYLKMTAQISTDFVKVTEFNLDEKIQLLLEKSGVSLQVDRCSFFMIDEERNTVSFRQGWHRDGIKPPDNRIFTWPEEAALPAWLQQIRNNEILSMSDVRELPPEVAEWKEQLASGQVQSLVAIPVMSKGRALGFLSYEAVEKPRAWRKEERDIMGILANLLADALTKVEAEKEISYLAYYDAQTGLPNRTLFKSHLEKAIHLAKRTETLVAVMFVDLDAFKGVNDALGHDGGDELLVQIGDRMSRSVRRYDTVARFGGDEFLIKIMNLTRVEDIHTVAKKILSTFKQPIVVREQEFFISASMGIAVYPQDGEDPDQLIKNADLALSRSKDKGRNQYTLCSPNLKDDVLRRMKLTNSLFRAQERNEFVLYYQPQVNGLTDEIVGMEALLRWEHDELGPIPPDQFIPLAEQTGMIHAIGFWVLETACMQNKKWQEMGLPPVRMSVNLSVGQFKNPRLVQTVAQILERSGLDPKYLELEVTESIAVEEGNNVIQTLQQLKGLGVTIAIDDFGTDYSSLSRLKELPVDRIKMAMSFIHDITEDESKDKAIASIIIQLAKSLNLNVIAEGVETEAQVTFLKQQQCDEIQGYYYYKPLMTEEMESVLAGRKSG